MNTFNLPPGIEPHFTRYVRFIDSRSKRTIPKNTYTEKHHIILTAKEHFISHHILWKCGYRQMECSFFMMSHEKTSTGKWGRRLTMKEYLTLKENFIENCLKGNKFRLDKKHSEKSKEQNRQAHLGKKASKETKEKISNANKGKFLSSEYRAKISKSLTGVKHTPERVEKMRQSKIGSKMSEEQKKKISEALKGRKKSKDHIQHVINGRLKYSRKVKCLETNIIYDSITYVEKNLGILHSTIIGCCKGKNKSAGGFHWEYVN